MKTREYRKQLAEIFANILEERQLEWKKGWLTDVPQNVKSGKAYKGMNRFFLQLIALERGYQDPRWATFKQVQEKGWRLKNAKGQGVKVEYWYPYDTEEHKVLTWEKLRELEEKIGDRYQLRAKYATVFNATLIDGIEPYQQREGGIKVDELVTRLSKGMEVPIHNDGGDQAFYDVDSDTIHMPRTEQFLSDYDYNATALHELGHATGAPHRLNRDLGGRFGSIEYAFEELVAEISSCFMSANIGEMQEMRHLENHRAYVQSWAQRIRENPEELVKAIQQAEKATSYMEYKSGLISLEEYQKVDRSAVNFGKEAVDKIPEREKMDEIKKGLQSINEDNQYLQSVLEKAGVKPEKKVEIQQKMQEPVLKLSR